VNAAAAAAAFEPERLRLARQLRGLRINELAKRVDVTPAAISQHENGHTRPTPQLLSRLALALSLPVGFFGTNGRPLNSLDVQPFFRSLRSTAKSERNQAHAWAVLCADLAHVLEQHVRLPPIDLPVIPIAENADRDAIERIAAEVRAVWGVPNGPVASVVRLLEVHGVVVSRFPFGGSRIDAFALPGRRPVVVLSDAKSDTARSRLDAAHELGHLVGHADADRADAVVERQAMAFGASLLAPADQIVDYLPRRFDVAAFINLKATWGMSIAALLYRSRELGVMTDAGYRRAVTWMSANGYRTTEPGDLGPPESPVLLERAMEVAESAGMSQEAVANAANLPLDLVLSLVRSDDLPAVEL
jgi:Zn-dependent peptidase ImmA (M78 family)/transcriptional regulator with XRE-family HTH domain